MRATAGSAGSVSWATRDFRPTIDSDSACGSGGMAGNRRLPGSMAGVGSEDRLVAGIDLATAEARVAVADRRGRGVAPARGPPAPPPPEVAVPRRRGAEPGAFEQDARSWWPAVARALGEALAAVASGRVAAV